jgi:hypothetical protein
MILSTVVCTPAISGPEPVAVLLLFGIWLNLQDFKANEARSLHRQ